MRNRYIRSLSLGLVLALNLSVASLAVAAAPGGKTETGSATDGNLTRNYSIYTPVNASPNAPLFVVLHGCFQSADQIAQGTRMNEWADKKGFYVLYPEQGSGDNPWKCWNFFLPENQKRTAGEAQLIAKLTQKVIADKSIDATRVYAAGLSAGAAMSSNLLACYSDIYSGGILHSGLEYGAAQDEAGAHDAMSNGPKTQIKQAIQNAYQCTPSHTKNLRVVVLHGDADPSVNPINGARTVQQFVGVDQLTTPAAPLTQMASRIDQQNFNYSASVTDYALGAMVVKYVVIEKMGHAWSGGSSVAPYMEPRGVDATKIGVEYLLGQ
jgi:poly(hydroxyalkanoate) depolymerase family esterase